MIKKYVFNYKVKTIPFWYVFTCYADSTDGAVSAFMKENPIGIEFFKIVKVYDVC